MATFQKRGSAWRVIVRKQGVSQSASFPTKAEAQAWASRIEAGILSGKRGDVPDKTFGELLIRYRDEVTPSKKGARSEAIRINRFLNDPIAQVNLREINTTHFAEWRDRRLKQVSPASVLRERNTMSNACKRALEEWRWLSIHPMKGVGMPVKPDGRDRRINQIEIDQIMHVCGTDMNTVIGRVGQAFLFAIATALRAGEIANLRWEHVSLEKKFLKVVDGKTQAARREVPLIMPGALECLHLMRTHNATGSIFHLSTEQIDAHFRKAKGKTLIEDLHFHDARHEAITRMSKKLDVLALARSVGHRDLKMLMIYYNETAAEIAARF